MRFLAFIAEHKANSSLHLQSSIILSMDLAIVWLCLSTTPLDHGDSAAVVLMEMLNLSQSETNSALANSPPLSERNLRGAP